MIDLVTSVFAWVTAHGFEVIGAAAVIAKLTPWTEDDEMVGALQKALNFIGLRAGYKPVVRDEE